MPSWPRRDAQLRASQHRQPASPIPGALEDMLVHTTSQAAGTTTNMRTVFLVLLLWAVASAHPVPGCEPDRPCHSAQQEATASGGYINKLGNLLGGASGRHSPASAETEHNALARDPTDRNAVDEELDERGGQDKKGRAGEPQHLNQMDHKGANGQDGNDFGFLEEDARDTDDGNGDYHGMGINGLPSHAGGFLDEEDDSGDDTFDGKGEEEQGEGPTYAAGANGVDEHTRDGGRGDAGAGGGHDDSSSSSSSESIGADHRRYRSYLGSRYEQAYRQRGGSSSSQEEEESYNFEDEAMQGDDPSAFSNLGSSYKGRLAGPHTRGWAADSHHWEEGESRSPEVDDTDSGEDSPSTEDNSESEDPVPSQSEEDSTSRSGEDEEDSPSKESESSKSRESAADWSDEEPGESPEDISQEVVNTSSERSGSQSQEGQEDQAFPKDSAQSAPDSKSEEDEGDQSQSTEDTMEKSEEDENDSNTDEDVLSSSAESQSESLEDDGSQEDNTGEDSSSRESNNSESPEDDDEESHSQEDDTRESNSHGDDSSPQSLEARNRKWPPGNYHNKAAVDYDDNDCQDGY